MIGMLLFGVIATAMAWHSFSHSTTAQPTTTTVHAVAHQPRRVLVLYFSWSGTTKEVAQTVHRQVGGRLVRLEPKVSYSSDYSTVSKRAGREYFRHQSPAVKTDPRLVDDYTDIFIGYPIWYGTAPMVVKSFLQRANLRGKNLYPFTTFASSRLGKSPALIKRAAPGARLLPGLAEDNPGQTTTDVKRWLTTIRFK